MLYGLAAGNHFCMSRTSFKVKVAYKDSAIKYCILNQPYLWETLNICMDLVVQGGFRHFLWSSLDMGYIYKCSLQFEPSPSETCEAMLFKFSRNQYNYNSYGWLKGLMVN